MEKSEFRKRNSSTLISRSITALLAVGLFCVGLISAAVTLAPTTASAATGINQTVNYQGRLLTAAGAVAPDGVYNMEFQIWQDGNGCLPTGTCTSANAGTNNAGTLKWTEDWVYGVNTPDNRIAVKNGYFSVNLGSICAFAATSCTGSTGNPQTNAGVNFNSDTLWLTTNIGNVSTAATFSVASGDGLMIPFKRLASNPYAINSGQLGGLTSGQFVQLGQGIQAATSTTNAAIGINQTGATANILDLQRGGADVQLINNSGQTLFRPTTDSQTALQVQKAGTTTVAFTVDTSNSRIGIGTGTPAWAVDAVGSVNASTSLKVAGTDVCTTSGCIVSGTSAILNQTGPQSSSNFNISGTGIATNFEITSGGLIDNSTASGTLNVGTTNATTVNIATNNLAHAIHIGDGGSSTAQNITIGSTTSSTAGTTLIQGGVNGTTPTVSLQAAANGVIAMGTTNANTIQIGAVGTTTNADTVHIADTTGAVAETVTVGSLSTTSTTSIQGGVNSTTPTVSVQAATNGYIAIGTTNLNHVQIGTVGSTANAGFVDIGDSTGAAQTVTLGSTNGASNTTIQGGTGNINLITNSASSSVIVGPNVNSTTAFQVQNATDQPIFLVDTATSLSGNFVTYGGFEAGTATPTGWSAIGAPTTFARNTTAPNHYGGLASLQLVTTATAANQGGTTSTFYSAPAAGTYTASFYVEQTAGTALVSSTLQIVINGSATSCNAGVTLNSNGFQRVTCPVTAGATITSLGIQVPSGSAAVRTIYIDAVQLVLGTSATPASASGAIQLRGAVDAPVVFQALSNSNTAFQIQNAAGTSNLFVADTLNNTLNLAVASTANSVVNLGAVGTTAFSSTVNIANSSGAAQTVSIGSTNGASTTTIQGGTGNVNLVTNNSAAGVLVAPTTDSTTAFKVQNAAAAAVLTVNTTNQRVLVGSIGLSTAQLYVSGQIPVYVNVNSDSNLTTPYAFAMQGRYAYVASFATNKLDAYDTASGIPVYIGQNGDSNLSGPAGVAVEGHFAYVISKTSGKLAIYDVSSSTGAGVFVGQNADSNLSSPTGVYVQGRYAYVTSSGTNKLVTYDISGSVPVFVGLNSDSNLSGPTAVYALGKYAYVTNGTSGKLAMYDISSGTPVFSGINSDANLSNPTNLFVTGKYAFIASTGNNKLVMYNITTGTPVFQAQNADSNLNAPSSVYVSQKFVYVASKGNNLLMTYEIATGTPVYVGQNSDANLSGPVWVYAQGRYAYVLNQTSGKLTTYDLGGTYIQQASVGGLEVDSLSVANDTNINADLNVLGAATVGQSLQVNGNIGTTGQLQVANTSATAFQVQNAAGTANLSVDTINDQTNLTGSVTLGAAANTSGSRVFSDSFDSGNFDQWNQGVTVSGTSTATVGSSPVHGGKYAAQMNVNTSGVAGIAQTFANTSTSLDMRAYVYVTSQTTGNADLITFNAGSNTFTAYRDSATGKLGLYNSVTTASAVGSTVMTLGAWHQVELDLTINNTTGSAVLYLDGTAVYTASGTFSDGVSNISGLFIGEGTTARASVFSIDDLSVDMVHPGDASNLTVGDSLHVAGSSSFGANVAIQNEINSTSVFKVQNAAGNNILNVDSVGNGVLLGAASGLTGQLVFNDASNAFTSTLQGNTATTASYVSIMPAAVGVSGQCLALASVAGATQTLGYATCSGGAGANVTLSNLTAGSVAINTDLTFASGAVRNINIGTETAGNSGDQLTISAGTGNGTNKNGGNLLLKGGTPTGIGTSSVIVQSNTNNSSSAFMVQNTAGSAILGVDTTIGNVNTAEGSLNVIGIANPATPTLTSLGSGGSLTAQTYYYRVAAIGAPLTYTTAVAPSPAFVTTSGSASKNTFSWSAVPNATGYIVYRSTNAGTTWFSNSFSSATLSIIDNGVTYTWTTSDTPSTFNQTGGINMQADTLLTFDAGIGAGSASILYSTRVNDIQIGNYNANGRVDLYTTGTTLFENTDSSSAFQIQNVAGLALLNEDATLGLFSVQSSTVASDWATVGSSLLSGNCSGTGWSGTGTGPYTHSSGSTPLTCTITGGVVVNNNYVINFTTTGMGATDTVTPAIGGNSDPATTGNVANMNELDGAGTTANPTFTLNNSASTGAISAISFKQVTTTSPVLAVRNSGGFAALNVYATGDSSNEFIGYLTGTAIQSGTYNDTGMGYTAFSSLTTGAQDTTFGVTSQSNTTTGSFNSSFGAFALANNTIGSENDAFGDGTMQFNTTGSDNAAFGAQSLQHNTNGTNNTAVGNGTLKVSTTAINNVAVGAEALWATTTGSNNTVIGTASFDNNIAGAGNVGIGFQSGNSLTAGSNDSAIGLHALDVDSGGLFATPNNIQGSTGIGAYSVVSGDHMISLGSVDTPTSVGIGTSKPTNLLSVSPLDVSGLAGTATQSGTTTITCATSCGWTSALVGENFIWGFDGKSGIIATASATTITLVTGSYTETGTLGWRIHKIGFEVTTAGTAYLQNTNTSEFSVQNSAGVSTLNVDTTNSRVSVGSQGTAASQLYVSGAIPTAATGSVVTAAGGGTQDVAIQGHYAYVTNFTTNTVSVIDITKPTAPVVLSTIASGTSGTNPFGIAVAGRYAYVVNGTGNTLSVIDITEPATPFLVANSFAITGATAPRQIYVQGHYAYIGDITTGKLFVVDISNPALPVLMGSVITGSTTYGIFVYGRWGYITNYGSANMVIVDLSNPSSPGVVGTATGVGTNVKGVYVQGRYAYVTSSGGGTLAIVDISNPAAPVVVGTPIAVGTNPNKLFVQGRYAYIVNSGTNSLTTVDVSNPAAPVVVGSVTTGGSPQQVVVEGRYAYVTAFTPNTLQVFDMGGAYVQQLESGGIETGTLQVDSNANVSGDVTVGGGLNVSQGALITGNLGVGGNLSLGQASAYTEVSTCSTTVNAGALYYNTTTNAIRGCVNGTWNDVATVDGLGLIAFGVVDNSGSNPGDLAANTTAGVTGPCKVSWSATFTVSVAPCTAYSGGRKVVVASATTVTLDHTVSGEWEHVCFNATGGLTATESAATATETNSTNAPTFSASAPGLCLADVLMNTTTGVAQIYDTRTFVSTTKEEAFATTAMGLGWIACTTVGTPKAIAPCATTTAGADTILGVVVATNFTTSAGPPNVILATGGPTMVKAVSTAGSVVAGDVLENSTTVNRVIASLAPNGTLPTVAYGLLGVSRSATPATACTTTANAANCDYGLYFSQDRR